MKKICDYLVNLVKKTHLYTGFTMMEILISLGIIGAMLLILIPAIQSAKPDENEALHKKATFVVERVINELSSDDYLYPNNGEYSSLSNTDNVTYNGKNHGGATKFCTLFASRINKKPGTDVNCTAGAVSVTSVEGISWYLPISDFRNGAETLLVDVNGSEGPNKIGEDQFEYQVQPGFKVPTIEVTHYDTETARPAAKPSVGDVEKPESEKKAALTKHTIACGNAAHATILGQGSDKVNGTYTLVAIPEKGYKCNWFTRQVTVKDDDVRDCALTCSPDNVKPVSDGDPVAPPTGDDDDDDDDDDEKEPVEVTVTWSGESANCYYVCDSSHKNCLYQEGEMYKVTIHSNNEEYTAVWINGSEGSGFVSGEGTIVEAAECKPVPKDPCYSITPTVGNPNHCPFTLPTPNCPNEGEEYETLYAEGTHLIKVTPEEGYMFNNSADPSEYQVNVKGGHATPNFADLCKQIPVEKEIIVTPHKDKTTGKLYVTPSEVVPFPIKVTMQYGADYGTVGGDHEFTISSNKEKSNEITDNKFKSAECFTSEDWKIIDPESLQYVQDATTYTIRLAEYDKEKLCEGNNCEINLIGKGYGTESGKAGYGTVVAKVGLNDGNEITIHKDNSYKTSWSGLACGTEYTVKVESANSTEDSNIQITATATPTKVSTLANKLAKPIPTVTVTFGQPVNNSCRIDLVGDGCYKCWAEVKLSDGKTARLDESNMFAASWEGLDCYKDYTISKVKTSDGIDISIDPSKVPANSSILKGEDYVNVNFLGGEVCTGPWKLTTDYEIDWSNANSAQNSSNWICSCGAGEANELVKVTPASATGNSCEGIQLVAQGGCCSLSNHEINFAGWKLDGKIISTAPSQEVKLTKDSKYTALFKVDSTLQTAPLKVNVTKKNCDYTSVDWNINLKNNSTGESVSMSDTFDNSSTSTEKQYSYTVPVGSYNINSFGATFTNNLGQKKAAQTYLSPSGGTINVPKGGTSMALEVDCGLTRNECWIDLVGDGTGSQWADLKLNGGGGEKTARLDSSNSFKATWSNLMCGGSYTISRTDSSDDITINPKSTSSLPENGFTVNVSFKKPQEQVTISFQESNGGSFTNYSDGDQINVPKGKAFTTKVSSSTVQVMAVRMTDGKSKALTISNGSVSITPEANYKLIAIGDQPVTANYGTLRFILDLDPEISSAGYQKITIRGTNGAQYTTSLFGEDGKSVEVKVPEGTYSFNGSETGINAMCASPRSDGFQPATQTVRPNGTFVVNVKFICGSSTPQSCTVNFQRNCSNSTGYTYSTSGNCASEAKFYLSYIGMDGRTYNYVEGPSFNNVKKQLECRILFNFNEYSCSNLTKQLTGSNSVQILNISGFDKTCNIADTYTVRVSAREGGTVSPTQGTVNKGGSLQISATPKSGYVFKRWDIRDGSGTFRGGAETANTEFYPTADSDIEASFERPVALKENTLSMTSAEFSGGSINGLQITIQSTYPLASPIKINYDAQGTAEGHEPPCYDGQCQERPKTCSFDSYTPGTYATATLNAGESSWTFYVTLCHPGQGGIRDAWGQTRFGFTEFSDSKYQYKHGTMSRSF